jgi:hypothetical protein
MPNQITLNGITYYDEPRAITLRYHEITDDPFPEPQEAEITFQIDGYQERAFAPLRIVDKGAQSVKAEIIGEGEDGNTYLVSFPPTNFGKTSFTANRGDIESIKIG